MPPLFASHGLVLLHLAQKPQSTMRELADRLGVSERRVASIVRELQSSGMIRVGKLGKRNTYSINEDAVTSQAALPGRRLGELLRGVLGDAHALGDGARKIPATFLHSLVLPVSLAESELPFFAQLLPLLA
jgi:DNA-binding Lrp family transcriptional regulator